jgi:RHS repeat-associated protein
LTYARGLDLSGSVQGAGGIGGLLALSTQLSTNNPQHFFYHADGSGNVLALVDAAGTVQARYGYEPFGGLFWQSGPLTNLNRLRFASKEMHLSSGLYDFGARWYDPFLQRWLTEDPLGEAGGLNLYQFVGNDPLTWVDPWGLAWYDYIPGIGVGIRRAQGEAAIQAMLQARGYSSMQEFQLEHPGLGGTMTAGNLDAVQAAADLAGGSADLYLIAASAVTPTAAGTRCVSLLLPGGKALGQAGSKATIRELQGGLKEAQALFDQLAQGGKVVPKSTYPGTWVELPGGGGVGIRTTATKSPGTAATIDVNIPSIPDVTKIKFNP